MHHVENQRHEPLTLSIWSWTREGWTLLHEAKPVVHESHMTYDSMSFTQAVDARSPDVANPDTALFQRTVSQFKKGVEQHDQYASGIHPANHHRADKVDLPLLTIAGVAAQDTARSREMVDMFVEEIAEVSHKARAFTHGGHGKAFETCEYSEGDEEDARWCAAVLTGKGILFENEQFQIPCQVQINDQKTGQAMVVLSIFHKEGVEFERVNFKCQNPDREGMIVHPLQMEEAADNGVRKNKDSKQPFGPKILFFRPI